MWSVIVEVAEVDDKVGVEWMLFVDDVPLENVKLLVMRLDMVSTFILFCIHRVCKYTEPVKRSKTRLTLTSITAEQF